MKTLHHRNSKLLTLLFIFLAAIIVWSTAPLYAAVALNTFTATETSAGKVELKWVTATEQDALEFYVKRVSTDASNFTGIGGASYDVSSDSQIIPLSNQGSTMTAVAAEGGPASGATYTVIDEDVVAGETYVYMLIQLELSGDIVAADTGDAHISAITLDDGSATGTVLGGGGSSNQPTNTPEPTATAAPTDAPEATDEPEPTATVAPTSTPEPTATTAPTNTPEPTATAVIESTEAAQTATAEPTATATLAPTNTPEPTATAIPTEEAVEEAVEVEPETEAEAESAPEPTAAVEETNSAESATEAEAPAAVVAVEEVEPAAEASPEVESAETAAVVQADVPVEAAESAASADVVAVASTEGEAQAVVAETSAIAEASTEADTTTAAGQPAQTQETVVIQPVANDQAASADADTAGGSQAAVETADGAQKLGLARVAEAAPEGEAIALADNSSASDAYDTAIEGDTTSADAPSAYEAGSADAPQQPMSVQTLGADAELPAPIDAAPASQSGSSNGSGTNPLIWVGFVVGLLVFASGIIGAIVVFNRQREA